MTFCLNLVRIHFASRSDSNYIIGTWKVLGARFFRKSSWWTQPTVHPSATILWPRVTCSLRFLIAWRTFVWELDVALQYNVSFKSCISRINQWTSWKRHAQAVVDVLLVSCPSVQCIRWSLVLAGWSFRSCLQNYIFCIRWTDWSLHWLVQLANSTNFDTLSKRRQRIDRLV